MDYQLIGVVFACIAVVVSIAQLALGFSFLHFLRRKNK